MKVLLHTCCAPCSVYCIKSLRAEGIEPTLFWYNPNIHPYAEYKARRDCLKKYADLVGVELILEDNYGLDKFVCEIAKIGLEESNDDGWASDNRDDSLRFRARCAKYCYPLRLREAFSYAAAHGYDAVSTTLLYSIYQQHEVIKDLGFALEREYGVKFLYRDFRKGWKEGQKEARSVGLYMQKYCGCVFSEEESFIGREISRDLSKAGISPTNAAVREILEEAKENGEVEISKVKKVAREKKRS